MLGASVAMDRAVVINMSASFRVKGAEDDKFVFSPLTLRTFVVGSGTWRVFVLMVLVVNLVIPSLSFH